MPGVGGAEVAAAPPQHAEKARTPARARRGRLPTHVMPIMPLTTSSLSLLSPWFNAGGSPCKGMAKEGAARGALELDQALARRGDDRLQLRMDLQLLDHMADVPLDGVGSDSKPPGHRGRVEAFREQVKTSSSRGVNSA